MKLQKLSIIVFIFFASHSCSFSLTKNDEVQIDIEDAYIIYETDKPIKYAPSEKISKDLEIVISYYNDTMFFGVWVERVILHDPFASFHKEVAEHQTRMYAIERRLFKYLINMNNSNSESDEEFENFMSSIDSDFDKLNAEFDDRKLNEVPEMIEDKIHKEKESTIMAAQNLVDRNSELEVSLGTLSFYDLYLFDPPANESDPENVDLSILTRVLNKTKEMEYLQSWQIEVGKYNITNADAHYVHFRMMKLITEGISDQHPELRHYTNLINKKRDRYFNLIPQAEAVLNKRHEKLMEDSVTTLNIKQKLIDLKSKVREFRTKSTKEEL